MTEPHENADPHETGGTESPASHDPHDAPLSEATPGRRKLLAWLAGGLGLLASAAAGVPILGFFLRPWVDWQPDVWVDVGPLDDFSEGETRLVTAENPVLEPWAGKAANTPMYVRRKRGRFTVFAINCAHLECPLSWFPESGLFLCPCHGGVYTEDGKNVAGPPPRPMYRYAHRVDKGRLLVRLGHLPNLSEPS